MSGSGGNHHGAQQDSSARIANNLGEARDSILIPEGEELCCAHLI